MEEKKEMLSAEEQRCVSEAILTLVKSFDGFPKTLTKKQIHIDELKSEVCIGIYPTSGAVVTKKYLSGSFEAQFPFDILYKCNPTTDQAVLAARKVLEDLSEWMETVQYPNLGKDAEFQKINRVTNLILAGATEDGKSVFKLSCVAKYFRRR